MIMVHVNLPGVFFEVLLLLVSGRVDPHATSTTPKSHPPPLPHLSCRIQGTRPPWRLRKTEGGHPKKSPGIQVG